MGRHCVCIGTSAKRALCSAEIYRNQSAALALAVAVIEPAGGWPAFYNFKSVEEVIQ
jgi:hypothetical protein